MAAKKIVIPEYKWYKANLTALSAGIFTDAFYPSPDKKTGDRQVFFTQIDITANMKKVIAVSKMVESGIRMMTLDLARTCLVPAGEATAKEMLTLNELTAKLKI